jgi:hypothetical protein
MVSPRFGGRLAIIAIVLLSVRDEPTFLPP